MEKTGFSEEDNTDQNYVRKGGINGGREAKQRIKEVKRKGEFKKTCSSRPAAQCGVGREKSVHQASTQQDPR